MRKTMCEKLQKQTGRQFLRALLLLTGLLVGTGMPKMQARAAQAVVSHGNLVYEGKQGNVGLYAADILLLEEKILTIPEQCFDPADYAHTYYQEYGRSDESIYVLTYEALDEVSHQNLRVSDGVTDTSDEPETEETLDTPEISDEPEAEEIPNQPEAPDESETGETSDIPDTFDELETEETPDPPETPDEPKTEDMLETENEPKTEDTPATSE